MRQTVVGVYDSYADACGAQRALIDAGFPQADISIYAISVSASSSGGPRVYAPGGSDVRRDKPVFDQLEQLFARLFERGEYPRETEDYREAIRRGGAIISADVSELRVDLACDVMRRTGAADIEERAKAWGNGSQGRTTHTLDLGSSTGHERSSVYPAEQSAVQQGEPPTTGAAPTPRSESPVTRSERSSSDAGYVGDPILGTPLDDDGSHDDEFRRDYDSRYPNSGAPYDDYRRAYAHGATLGRDERYSGQEWQEVEPSVREHWESHYPESGWARFKAAVRHGWERVTGRS